MISPAFRVLAALIVAVPLGAGGLCCCLLGAPDAAADSAAASRPSCCAEESVPAPSSDCPEHDEDCSCPSREAGVLAKSAPTETVSPEAPTASAPLPLVAADVMHRAAGGNPTPPAPHPPPKVPLHRTLCVILC
jgi:hypothetical protein